MSLVDTIVLPGDIVIDIGKQKSNGEGNEESNEENKESMEVEDGVVRIGTGLIQNELEIVATKAGVLRKSAGNVYWIENHQKRVSGEDRGNHWNVEILLLTLCDIHSMCQQLKISLWG